MVAFYRVVCREQKKRMAVESVNVMLAMKGSHASHVTPGISMTQSQMNSLAKVCVLFLCQRRLQGNY